MSASFDDIRQLFLERSDAPEDAVTAHTQICDLGMESRDLASLLADLEDTYHLEFNAAQIGNLVTVGDVYALVRACLAQPSE